jgi:hypothetical protein
MARRSACSSMIAGRLGAPIKSRTWYAPLLFRSSMRRIVWFAISFLILSCSLDTKNLTGGGGTGGAVGTGGTTSTGGQGGDGGSATGGQVGTGGSATGGQIGAGGETGGQTGTGGSGTGGQIGTGGSATGGQIGAGGETGGQTGTGGSGTGGQIGTGGSATGGQIGTGGDQGTAGSASGGQTGTGGNKGTGGETCQQLATNYVNALPAAKDCTYGVTGQCQQLVASSLTCGCQVYVNDATTLNAIKAQYVSQGCGGPICNIACVAGPASCTLPVATPRGPGPGGASTGGGTVAVLGTCTSN